MRVILLTSRSTSLGWASSHSCNKKKARSKGIFPVFILYQIATTYVLDLHSLPFKTPSGHVQVIKITLGVCYMPQCDTRLRQELETCQLWKRINIFTDMVRKSSEQAFRPFVFSFTKNEQEQICFCNFLLAGVQN